MFLPHFPGFKAQLIQNSSEKLELLLISILMIAITSSRIP